MGVRRPFYNHKKMHRKYKHRHRNSNPHNLLSIPQHHPSVSFGTFPNPNQLLRIPRGNSPSFPAFSDPNQLLIIPESKSNSFPSLPDPNQSFPLLSSGNVNFIAGQNIMHEVITTEARKKRQIIHGARAMNKQLPLGFQRPTEDYDIYTSKPKRTAHRIQSVLDQEVAGGRDEFFVKPAIHPGTHKVVHVGEDMKKGTEDDITVVDYTEMPVNFPSTSINGLRYETLPHIKKGKEKTLKDPEAKFRHEKDREDLERIELAKSLRGGF